MSFIKLRKYAVISEKVVMYEIMVKQYLDEALGCMSVNWFKDKHWLDLCLVLFPVVHHFIEAWDNSKEISLLNTFRTAKGLNVQIGYCFQPILSSVRCCLNPGVSFGQVENGCYKLYDFYNVKLVASVSSVGSDPNELVKGFGFNSTNSIGIYSYFPRVADKPLNTKDEANVQRMPEVLSFEKKPSADMKNESLESQLHSESEDSLDKAGIINSKQNRVCNQFHSPVLHYEENGYAYLEEAMFLPSQDFAQKLLCDKPTCTSESGIESDPVSMQEYIQTPENISERNGTSLAETCVSKSVPLSSADCRQTLIAEGKEESERLAMTNNENAFSSVQIKEENNENSELVSIREFIELSYKTNKSNNPESVGDSESNSGKSNNCENRSGNLEKKLVRKPTCQKLAKNTSESVCKRPIDDRAINMELASIRDCLKLSSKFNEKPSEGGIASSSNSVRIHNFKFSKSPRRTNRRKKQLKIKGCASEVTESNNSVKTVDDSLSSLKTSSANHPKNLMKKDQDLCVRNISNSAQQLKPLFGRNKDNERICTKPCVSEYFPSSLMQPLSEKIIGESRATISGDQRQENDCLSPTKLMLLPINKISSQNSRVIGDCESTCTDQDRTVDSGNLLADGLFSGMNLKLQAHTSKDNASEDTTVCFGARQRHKQRLGFDDTGEKSDLDEFQNSKAHKEKRFKRKPTAVLGNPAKVAKKQILSKAKTKLKGGTSHDKDSMRILEVFCAKEDACKDPRKNPAVCKKINKSELGRQNSQIESYSSDESLPESGIFNAKAGVTEAATNGVSSLMPLQQTSDKSKCMQNDNDSHCEAAGFNKNKVPNGNEKTSWQLYEEIRNIREIQQLSDCHLMYLLKLNEQYIKNIFRGKQFCQRHEDFKKGGSAKENLNHTIHLTLFSDDHLDLVLNFLEVIFCKKDKSCADYVLRVLFPETLIKIVMDVRGITHEESEEFMFKAVYQRQ